jgi:hypothetical protein
MFQREKTIIFSIMCKAFKQLFMSYIILEHFLERKMKFFVFMVIFLSYVFIAELSSIGTTFLSCPNGDGLIDCSEIKCYPSAVLMMQ